MGRKRKVGENFDSNKADSIFDKLKNVEGKIKPKKEDSKFKNISNLMSEAKYLEKKGELGAAIDLYKQVIFELPDASKVYSALLSLYEKRGDVNSQKDILKKAISNCHDNKYFKDKLKELE